MRIKQRLQRWGIESSEDRVARGAAFLDSAYPGWEHQVNPDTIDLRTNSHCVLGQVSRARRGMEYRRGFGAEMMRIAWQLHLRDDAAETAWAFARGFLETRSNHLPHPIRRKNLEFFWRLEIETRRAERPRFVTVSPEVQVRLQAGVV